MMPFTGSRRNSAIAFQQEKTMRKAVLGIFVILLTLSTAAQAPRPATDVTAAQIQATLKQAIAKNATDTPIRTVDAGGHNVGIGLVYRPKGAKGTSASHDKVSEVYQVLEGAGTLVTGGTMVNPKRRDSGLETVTQINGPGVTGDSIQGGVSRRIAKGDMVIIPAGTPHWWSEIQETISYTVVRIDPSRVVALK
jgi:quercetin dioxygenase-like cupin family protein